MNSSYVTVSQTVEAKPPTNQLEPIKGYLYGFLFVLFATSYTILLKLSPTYSVYNQLAVRYLLQALVVSSFLGATPETEWFGPKSSRMLLAARGLSGAVSVSAGIVSLKFLQISDVETLINTSVVITAVLGRIFLKEKITVAHLVSLLATVVGVVFILKPDFLFSSPLGYGTGYNASNTTESMSPESNQFTPKLIGVSCILVSSLFISITNVSTRQLALHKIHITQILIYPCYFAVPFSLAMSALDLLHTRKPLVFEPLELCFSVAGALGALVSMYMMSKALEYEEAGKICLLRTLGVLLAYGFQCGVLGIELDVLGLVGAILVVLGNLIMFLTKYAGVLEECGLCKFLTFKF